MEKMRVVVVDQRGVSKAMRERIEECKKDGGGHIYLERVHGAETGIKMSEK